MRSGPVLAALGVALAALTPCAGVALAAQIGIAVPLSGPLKTLGDQAVAGATAAARLSGDTLTVEDDACTADSGAAIGARFASQKVDVAIGFLCLESLNAALPALKGAGIPALTIGVRANALTDTKSKTGFLVSRLAPRDDMEGKALARLLLPEWAKANFAIIDDGTIHARDLAEEFRAEAAQAGLAPVFTDTFRPGLSNQSALVRRLRKAGADTVLIGGDIDDALVISNNALQLGGLAIALGEAGEPTVPDLAHGPVSRLELPDLALLNSAAAAVLSIEAEGVIADNYALLAHAAVEIASQAARQGAPATIGIGPYTTAIGDIRFDSSGDLAVNPYRLSAVAGQ